MAGCSKQWCIRQFHAIRWRGRSRVVRWGYCLTNIGTCLYTWPLTTPFTNIGNNDVVLNHINLVVHLVHPTPHDLPRHLIAWNCLIHHCLLHPPIDHSIHLQLQSSRSAILPSVTPLLDTTPSEPQSHAVQNNTPELSAPLSNPNFESHIQTRIFNNNNPINVRPTPSVIVN